jgi:hypothetical protein
MTLGAVLFFALLFAIPAWLFPPEGGWLDYIKSCPLWHKKDPPDAR